MACREWRIDGSYGARADNDRVGQRAHAVQVQNVFLAGDVLRLAGVRGDEPVETLAEVTDRDGPGYRRAADRQVEIDERMARVVRRKHRHPAGAGTPRDHRIGMSLGNG